MSKPDPDAAEAGRPSALLQNLAVIAARDPRAHKRFKDARYGSSSGPASAGKRLTVWRCTCEWTGAAQELKLGAGRLCCPSCGEAGGLRSV